MSQQRSLSVSFNLNNFFTVIYVLLFLLSCINLKTNAAAETYLKASSPENVPTIDNTVQNLDCLGIPNGTAFYGECGCGDPPPMADERGCCPGDTTCGECLFVAGYAPSSDSQDENNIQSIRDRFQYSHRERLPNCFKENYVDEFLSCEQHSENRSVEIWSLCRQTADPTSLADFLKVPEDKRDARVHYSGIMDGNGESEICFTKWLIFFTVRVCLPAMEAGLYWWYMDSNCNYVADPPAGQEICGFAGVAWTPVSLIWDNQSDWQSKMTIVSFPLDPQQEGYYSLWKASAKAPLLVFDPEGSGKVTSARQLFGNFALGGKTVQLADYKLSTLRPPWDNGFESMALLDTDNDGRLSGEELETLRLWFDNNQDAQVDAGELRSLKQEQVTALYYKNPKKDEGSRDVALEIGYERVVDGKTVVGKSVDWYAETFATKQEAALALQAMSNNKPTADLARSDISIPKLTAENWPDNPVGFTPHIANDHSNDLSGFWYWEFKEEGGSNNPGILALEQLPDKTFVGYSVTESKLAKNKYRYRSGVVTLPAVGAVEHSKDGITKVVFEVLSPKNNGRAVSSASIAADGKTMHGKTSQTFPAGNTAAKNRSVTVDYEWVARKFVKGSQS